MKNIRVFLSENFPILEMKFSIYLNRCVFVMGCAADLSLRWEYMSEDTFANVITKTRLSKYTENFTTKKWKFSDKKF